MQQNTTPHQQPQQTLETPIALRLTLPHSTIIAQILEQAIKKGIDDMALRPGAKPGEDGWLPASVVVTHVSEVASGLHRAIQEAVTKIQQQQQMHQQGQVMGMPADQMMGNAYMPDGKYQQQPHQENVHGINGAPVLPPGMNPTDFSAPGVNQVPLANQPAQGGPPTLMPNPNPNPNDAAAPANGADGNPVILKP